MADSDVKTPPYSPEAEKSVLGAIMADASSHDGDRVFDMCLARGIRPDSFFDPRNRLIFSTMLSLNRNANPLDINAIITELKRTGGYDTIGGPGYLEGIAYDTPIVSHSEYYINILLEKHLRRLMIEAAKKTIENCYDEKDHVDSQAVLGEAEKSFLEISKELVNIFSSLCIFESSN